MKLLRKIMVAFALGGICSTVAALEPDGYYTSCENKGGFELLKALHNKIGSHTQVSYDGLWELYKKSDVKANGKIWDMYSTKEWPVSSERCGNYKNVGDCYNREHSFPKSWFNDAKPMYSDAFHLYPTDGKVNGQRSNFPYGECSGGTTLPSNGAVKALGRLGTSTFPGYSGKVFEPVDDYKGDFARSYFYMATAYNDRIASWNSDMLAHNQYPAFSSWAVELLLKWHRQDPVSQKELDRNEVVYSRQNNRNPFIDHPELAEYIWGNKKTERWTLNVTSEPELVLPVNGSVINFGNVGVGFERTVTTVVKSYNIKENITLTVAGDVFSVSPATVSAAAANAYDGIPVNIKCKASVTGSQSAVMTVRSGNLISTVTLTANAFSGIPASQPSTVSDCSFIANWTYIGSEDANGCYILHVLDADGNDVDTYPRSVPARDETYLVDEIEPSTSYTYYLTSNGLRSNTITVTTSAPIPSIQFLYPGDLLLESEPGEPSDAVEILLDIDNIDTAIEISVNAPFELSADKLSWSDTLSVSPEEDRIYLRINSATEGTFTSSLKARAGSYINDDTDISGRVSSTPDFVEDFEAPGSGNYSSTAYNGTAAQWLIDDAGVYSSSSEAANGLRYLRMGKNSTSSLTLNETRRNGIGTLTFNAATWAGDAEAKIDIQTSEDSGVTWKTVSTVTIPSTSTLIGNNYKQYTVTINKSGPQRLRLQQTQGKRVGIDDLALTNYTSGVIDGVESDTRMWDAFCRDHLLTIELQQQKTVSVYGVDGRTYASCKMPAGTTTLQLPAGLYIVVVDDFSRRVMVK